MLPDRSQPKECENEGNDVLVLGGTAAVDDVVLQQLSDAGLCPIRLAGPDRIGTATEVAFHRLAEYSLLTAAVAPC